MSDVVVEKHGLVTLVRINRPARMNALNVAVVEELREALMEVERSDQRAAVISAAGNRAFSAGADLGDVPPELPRCVPGIGFPMTKPIVAAISGWCVGGAISIAMMSDLIVATESAKFYYPESKLGFSGGMITSLAARMPLKIAMEIMLLGREVSGARAYEVGFVNTLVKDGEQEAEALKMAAQMAASAPFVLQTLKRLVNEHIIPKGPVVEMIQHSQSVKRMMTGEDAVEGMAAQKEKRAPVFTGR